ncbi:MAG: hypothetical protein ACD_41C00347G0003, partial [uncultured bacterium]
SSALIVAYPVLVYLTWVLQKEFKLQPGLRDMRTRRWLLYFTQFATAITIIIDLMVLIYEFYGGEITARFVSKVIVVLVVAALVLGYYRWELHRSDAVTKLPKIMASSVGAVLLASIIAGFFIAGTPAQQRAIRLDDQRVNQLMEIQNYILSFAQTKAKLPTDQTALEKWSGTLPTDPVTDSAYVYTKLSDATFQLCATFAADQTEDRYGEGYYYGPYPEKIGTPGAQLVGGSSWVHPAGYYCFDRTVEFTSAAE